MPSSINETIRILRNLRGYKQSFMALKMGITQQDYSHLEKHGKHIADNQITLICEILEVTEESLEQFDPAILLEQIKKKNANINSLEDLLSGIKNKDEVVIALKAFIKRLLENIRGLRNQIKVQNETIKDLRQMLQEKVKKPEG